MLAYTAVQSVCTTPKAAWTWKWGAEVCSAVSKGAASPFQHNSRSWSCREREMKEVRGATASLRREGICRKGRRPQEMCGICLPGSSCGRVDTRPYTLTPGWCWHFQKSGDHWLTYLISSEVYSSCWNLVIFCKTDTFPIPIPKANWLNLREGCTKKGDVAKGQTFYGQWKSHPVLIYKDNAL